jgi:predicted amidophosphoribosyltransferase
MDGEKQRQQPEQAEVESALLKRHAELHQLIQECQDCQREIESHWQFCAHCGVRLATQCPNCGNPLPPLGAQACPACGLALPSVQS